MATNPMHQFQVYKIGPEINLGDINLSFTNASLFMTISSALILLLLFLGTKKKSLVPTKIQFITEMSYTFIAKMINDTAGSTAKSFFPFIFTLFMFVLFCNMVGMLPYSFTVTSHIVVTFVLAAIVFVGVTVLGFINHGIKYFVLFAIASIEYCNSNIVCIMNHIFPVLLFFVIKNMILLIPLQ